MKPTLPTKLISTSKEGLSGIMTGTVAITVSLSMAALIFHGSLANFIGYGIGAVLCTTIFINSILLIGSSYKGVVAAPQSATSIVLATGKADKLNQFNAVLEEIFENENETIQFKSYLSRKLFKKDTVLMKKGECSETLYFIETGQFSVLRNDHKKSSIRYRKIGSGAIIGEMGFFSNNNRTASVISDKDSYIYELNLTNMKKMEKDCSKIAFKFQNYVIKLLSMRLSRSTQEINSLLIDYKNR